MIRFKLWYKNLLIGILEYDTLWIFQYSEEFKNQTNVKPLSQFQNIDQIYFSDILFTMFKVRIPPPTRPDILLNRTANGIEDDDISMLIHYGRRCITDPFILTFNPVD